MNNSKKLEPIKNLIKDKNNLSLGIFEKTVRLLCDNILEYAFEALKQRITDDIYEYYILNKILIRWNQNLNHSAALSKLSSDICSEDYDYEWGILLHGDGIWLLNRDIPMGKTYFGSKRTVFKLSFINKTDIAYLEFFKSDYLLGYNKSIYFFRDIIRYKNTIFPSDKSNSWDVYWTCNKRFFSFYVLQCKGSYSDDEKTCYADISLKDYEEYIRKSSNIKTANTAKNQFFYIKAFVCSRTYNKSFDVGSCVILKRCEDILIERDKELGATDIKKVARIIKHITSQRNGIRNKTIFLLLLCFGIERRKICELKWSDISANCVYIRIGSGKSSRNMLMPEILQDSIRELKTIKVTNAIYIFGNSRTQWLKPLPEGGINDVLDCIRNIDKNDEFYSDFSPADIRKWLFRFMVIEKRLPLQDVIWTMNIPLCNIGNYIKDDELSRCCTEGFDGEKKYILDDWCKELMLECRGY